MFYCVADWPMSTHTLTQTSESACVCVWLTPKQVARASCFEQVYRMHVLIGLIYAFGCRPDTESGSAISFKLSFFCFFPTSLSSSPAMFSLSTDRLLYLRMTCLCVCVHRYCYSIMTVPLLCLECVVCKHKRARTHGA